MLKSLQLQCGRQWFLRLCEDEQQLLKTRFTRYIQDKITKQYFLVCISLCEMPKSVTHQEYYKHYNFRNQNCNWSVEIASRLYYIYNICVFGVICNISCYELLVYMMLVLINANILLVTNTSNVRNEMTCSIIKRSIR